MATDTLNSAQHALLSLIATAPAEGCTVYGRAYAATAVALHERGLLMRMGIVHVASMGSLERRALWAVTPAGRALLARGAH